MGLVDALGGYRTAIDLAKDAAGLAADEVVQLRRFPAARGPFAFLEDTLGDIQSPATLSLLRSLARAAELLAPLVRAAQLAGGDPRRLALHSPVATPVRLPALARFRLR